MMWGEMPTMAEATTVKAQITSANDIDEDMPEDLLYDEAYIGALLPTPPPGATGLVSADLFYLPTRAVAAASSSPIDFKRQRITSSNPLVLTGPSAVPPERVIDAAQFQAVAVASIIEEQSFAVVSYAGHSKKGYAPYNPKKKNQDSLLMAEDAPSRSLLLACFDGHGEFGHKISQEFKRELGPRLFGHPKFTSGLKEAIAEVVSGIEHELLQNTTIDTNFSGTTMVLAVVRGHHMTVANVGDSRLTLGSHRQRGYEMDTNSPAPHEHSLHASRGNGKRSLEQSSTRLVSIPITIDHKPELPIEKERILSTGGRVFAVEYLDGVKGPERVWLSDMNVPGLAMSRSLCDHVAHTVGVSSTPEFFERTLDPTTDCVLVMATDGLWEFITDQEAIDVVTKAGEPSAAVNELIKEATARWLLNESVVDDTTVCVAILEGST